MNYVYIHRGEYPNYLKYSINSVLSVDSNSKVYLIGENDPNFKNVNFININEITSNTTLNLIELNIYNQTNYDPEINTLWETSLLRVFYLNDFLNETNIKECVHFDNDVLIYKEFSSIKSSLSSRQFNITEHIKDTPIYGYSYIPNSKIYNLICSEIINYLENIYMNDNYFKSYPLNEMEILKIIKIRFRQYFFKLPSLPYEGSKNLFDPATYGQYLGGTHAKPNKLMTIKRAQLNHLVGSELSSKRIKAVYKNNEPKVIYNNKIFDLVNLHIHSKNLYKFLPNKYRNLVNF